MQRKWIWVCNWTRFQHYKDRNPPWIKNYVELLSNEDYLDLSSHRRGVLHGVWLAFASSHGRLSADPRSLSSRLRLRVTTADLVSLNHARFIDIVASTPLAERLQAASKALASRAYAHSQEAEAETEEDKPLPPEPYLGARDGLPDLNLVLKDVDW